MNENSIKDILDKHNVENSEALANALSEILPQFLDNSIGTIDEKLGKLVERQNRGRLF
ncbi:hypothetical protein [Lactococcus petauri]|uniref:hypothetical protein n=1 Tax=Lactococcus petauri TaxID=1940789 RepID=UPI0038519322